MALCLLAMTLTLASCEDGQIGSYLENYDWEPEVIEDVTLDFYIIVGEGTSENAMTTVRDKINQYLSDKYHTKLEIHYLTADEYDSTVATKNSGIVLITSKALMDEFMRKNALVDLKDYLAKEGVPVRRV
jgi:ABC-type glycerol-3-phosphate transport system substrate-binding protein